MTPRVTIGLERCLVDPPVLLRGAPWSSARFSVNSEGLATAGACADDFRAIADRRGLARLPTNRKPASRNPWDARRAAVQHVI